MRLAPVIAAVTLALAASLVTAPVTTAADPRWTAPATILGPARTAGIAAFTDGDAGAAAVAFDGADYNVLASAAASPGWTVAATIPADIVVGRESSFSISRAGDTIAVAWCRKLPGAALGDIIVWTSASGQEEFVDLDDVKDCREVAIGGAVLAATGSPTFTVAWPIRVADTDVLQSRTLWNGQWLAIVGLWAEIPSAPANYIVSPEVQVAANGAAAVGFIVGTPQPGLRDVPLLWLATRGAAQGGVAPSWAQAFAVDNAFRAPGDWDMALSGDAPSSVAIAWASDAGVLPTVQYANTTLVFGAQIARRQILVANGRRSVDVSIDSTSERDLLAWVDVNDTTDAYTVRSSAWHAATNAFATVTVTSGSGFGSGSLLAFDASADGRMALAFSAAGGIAPTSSIEIFQDTFTTPAALWATKTRTPITSLDADTTATGLGVLVPPGTSPAGLLWSTRGRTSGVGAVQSSREVTPEPPGRPTNVTATAGDSAATVSWRAPAGTGTSTITGYVVTSTPEGKTCTTNGALTCTVPGLTNGTRYVFTVTASSADGSSQPSVPSAAVTPVSAARPGPPRDVVAVGRDASAQVRWTAPASPGASPVTGYVVTSTPEGKTCTTNGALTCTVTDLTNGRDYLFTVVASNADGPGAPSDFSNIAIPTEGRAPGAPRNVRATAGDAAATVTWVAPADSGSSPILEYVVASTPEGKTCSTAGALTCTVTGLTNGAAYTFAVIARSADGLSLPSANSNEVTPTSAAARPDPPATFTVKARKGGRVILTWSASASAGVTGYAVAIVKADGTQRVRDVGNVLTKTYRVKAGKRACYEVAAVSAAGRGDWTARKCVVSKR